MNRPDDEIHTIAQAAAHEELQKAIEGLYTTFSSYPLRAYVEGCACCVSPEDEARLHSKPLRELTRDELDEYASAALLTWGDADDFRYFLPRLFELMTFDSIRPGHSEIVFSKLRYARWRTWPEGEQAAVESFLSAWWRYVLARCPFTGEPLWTMAGEDLCSIAQAIDDLGPFLRIWRESQEISSRYHLAHLIDGDGWDTLPYKLDNGFWEWRPTQMRQVIDWVLEPATLEILRQALVEAPAEFVPVLAASLERLVRLQTCSGPDQDNR